MYDNIRAVQYNCTVNKNQFQTASAVVNNYYYQSCSEQRSISNNKGSREQHSTINCSVNKDQDQITIAVVNNTLQRTHWHSKYHHYKK